MRKLTWININPNATSLIPYHLKLNGENWPPVVKPPVNCKKKKSSEQ